MLDASQDPYSLASALRSNGPFLALAAALGDAVLIVSDAGQVIFASDRIGDFLDWKPDELVGRDFLDLFHEDDRAELPFNRAQEALRER